MQCAILRIARDHLWCDHLNLKHGGVYLSIKTGFQVEFFRSLVSRPEQRSKKKLNKNKKYIFKIE
jgi:hypothetical protein